MLELESRATLFKERRQPIELSPLVVLFGKPGAGKDTVSQLLRDQYDYYVYNADSYLPDSYKAILKAKQLPSQADRDVLTAYQIRDIFELQQSYPKVLMNWAFVLDRQRQIFRNWMPDSQFILVDTPRSVIEQRLRDAPRVGHNLTTDLAMKLGDAFEQPTIEHSVVYNTGKREELLDQFL